MWSIGCIFGELLLERVLFEGSSSLDQLNKIFTHLGRPTREDLKEIGSDISRTMLYAVKTVHKIELKELFKDVNEEALDLLKKLLAINPKKRVSAKQALRHPYLSQLVIADPVREK